MQNFTNLVLPAYKQQRIYFQSPIVNLLNSNVCITNYREETQIPLPKNR